MTDNRRYPDAANIRGRSEVSRTYTGGIAALPGAVVPAMAYVPYQTETATYHCGKALSAGTIFPCLDKPFLGGKCQ